MIHCCIFDPDLSRNRQESLNTELFLRYFKHGSSSKLRPKTKEPKKIGPTPHILPKQTFKEIDLYAPKQKRL